MAQWVKHWPTELEVSCSSPASGGALFNNRQGLIAHSLSLSPAHHPDITEILLLVLCFKSTVHIYGHIRTVS